MTPTEMARLHRACFSTPRPWRAEEFTELLTRPGSFAVAQEHGFAVGQVFADEAELLTLAVDPRHRRSGWGSSLLKDFENRACDAGAVTAFLEVAAGNTAAIGLYQRHDYLRAGRRKQYYRHPDGTRSDAVVMRRALVLPPARASQPV